MPGVRHAAAVVASALATAAGALTLCAFPTNEELAPPALVARHAVAHYAAKFPAAGPWEFRLLGNGQATRKNVVMSFVRNGTHGQCDGVIGPGYSSLSTALSPVVEVPWLCFYATSTALSDKDEHPAFSRVIPNDDRSVALAVEMMLAIGWRDVSFLGLDDAYGRSQAAGLNAALASAGGRVHVSRFAQYSGSKEEVRTVLRAVAAGAPRVVYMAMLQHGAFAHVMALIGEEQLDERLIFVFSDGACSASDNKYRFLKSALCATLWPRRKAVAEFAASYEARDVEADRRELQVLGHPDPGGLALRSLSVLSLLGHDATLHMMRALEANAKAGTPLAGQALIQFMRDEVTTNGSSGLINLTTAGEREQATFAIYNAIDGTEVPVARLADGKFDFIDRSGRPLGDTPPEMVLLGSPTATIPAAMLPVPPADEGINATLAALLGSLVGVGVLILAAVGVVLLFTLRRHHGRDHKHAPQDVEKPFAIVFTDIQASTAMWGRAPEIMSTAVETHHDLIRDAIDDHGGYEVKTIGDSFMVAFKDLADAVRFALAVQEALQHHDWGTDDIDRIYWELLREAGIALPVKSLYDDLWCGLRVRVGVHFGVGSIQRDRVTQSFDYYGTVVNTAARVEAVSHGGQVCVTAAVVDALGGHDAIGDAFGAQVTDLGPQPLRGLDEPVAMTQLLPTRLAGRRFPPLRLEVDVGQLEHRWALEETEEDTSHSAGVRTMQSRLSLAVSHVDEESLDDRHRVLSDFVRALHGPLCRETRASITAELASRWRVRDFSKITAKRLRKDRAATEAALRAVLRRAMPAFDMAQARQGNPGRGLSSCVRSARSHADSPGATALVATARDHLSVGAVTEPLTPHGLLMRGEGEASGAEASLSPMSQNISIEVPSTISE